MERQPRVQLSQYGNSLEVNKVQNAVNTRLGRRDRRSLSDHAPKTSERRVPAVKGRATCLLCTTKSELISFVINSYRQQLIRTTLMAHAWPGGANTTLMRYCLLVHARRTPLERNSVSRVQCLFTTLTCDEHKYPH